MKFEDRGEAVYNYLSYQRFKARKAAEVRRHINQSLSALAVIVVLFAVVWVML